jgi:uncharacterized protein (TIGR03067 family)
MNLFRRTALVMVSVLCVPFASAGGDPKAEAVKKELAVLQGVWKLTALEIDGKTTDFPENPPRWFIKEDKVRYGGQELAALMIDAATTPRSIDLAFLSPKRSYEGIYSVTGDTLKICVNRQTEGVKERPVGFATKDNPEWRLLVFKRDQAGKADETEGLSGFVGIAIGIAIGIEPNKKELVIAQVIDGGPAKKAGLKKDDILLRVGGRQAEGVLETVRMIRAERPGSESNLRIRRDGKERDVTVKVGVAPFSLLD